MSYDEELKQAYRSLSRERTPPAHLEERVVEALKSRRLILPPLTSFWARSSVRTAVAGLAATMLLIVGFAMGKGIATPPVDPSDSRRFLLLLYNSPQVEAAYTPERSRQLVNEYGTWASEMRRAGYLVSGEPLRLGGRQLRKVDSRLETRPVGALEGEEVVVGYFLIRAGDYDQAVEIAESCPHLKYQGTILVRQIGDI